jgi:hypothetical protein
LTTQGVRCEFPMCYLSWALRVGPFGSFGCFAKYI